MPPRLEFALLAGVLAAALAASAQWLMAVRDFGWPIVPAAGLAAAASAAWTSGWRLVECRARPGWRCFGLAFFTVLIAQVCFIVLVAAFFLLMEPGWGVLRAIESAALFGLLALAMGGVPALLLTVPLALRHLRRRDRAAAA